MEEKRKQTSSSCIFCGDKYLKNKMRTSTVYIDYIHVPPLGDKFQPVCIFCKDTTLQYYIDKYPDLFLQD